MKKLLLALFYFLSLNLFSQELKVGISDKNINYFDPCLFDSIYSKKLLSILGPGWGYNYDNLLSDIQVWKNNIYTTIDSVGSSTQGRGIWLLSITSKNSDPNKRRIWIHARTHPNEIQGWEVTKEIIKTLMSESSISKALRDNFIFNIIPMYNPDGVDLGYLRENANKIDIESNWNNPNPEKEVLVLKSQFVKFMNSSIPIRLALNMHSAYDCKRFFVYHHENGSSVIYSLDEQNFIRRVRNYFPSGMQDWNYSISWLTAPGLQYPEGWFWSNYKEKVLALTYEDMNCTSAGEYNKTANAILSGILDFFGVQYLSVSNYTNLEKNYFLKQNYPNPFNPSTDISFFISMENFVSLKVYDELGREIKTLLNERKNAGNYKVQFDGSDLPSGIYFYRIVSGEFSEMKKMVLSK